MVEANKKMLDPFAFICIYCLRTQPDVVPSKAHIFPDSMGGSTFATDTVCRVCNERINQEVEMPTLRPFAFFRSIWGIRGHRKDIVRVRATVRFAEKEQESFLNEWGEPAVIVQVKRDAAGNKTYSILGPPENVEAKRQEIAKKFPNLKWEEQDLRTTAPLESLVEFELDLAGIYLRRLAAKVAFERFAQLRGGAFVADEEFDQIRDFVLNGKEQQLCCGVLSDPRLLEGSLNFPLPNHAIVIIAHPYDRALGAFVTFYSLFYYWVILSTSYRALGPADDLLLENPQTRESGNPRLRYGTGSIRVRWDDLVNAHHHNPLVELKAARSYATKKFQASVAAFYHKKKT